MKKTEDITTFAYREYSSQTNNQRKRLMKNKKGIDPEVNKIVSCGKNWKKMFHALHKVDMRA